MQANEPARQRRRDGPSATGEPTRTPHPANPNTTGTRPEHDGLVCKVIGSHKIFGSVSDSVGIPRM
jgi:hypothetical protein